MDATILLFSLYRGVLVEFRFGFRSEDMRFLMLQSSDSIPHKKKNTSPARLSLSTPEQVFWEI
jgi:hypothetical protein